MKPTAPAPDAWAANPAPSRMKEFLRVFVPLAVLVVAAALQLVLQGTSAQTQRELAQARKSAEVAAASVAQSLSPVMLHIRSLAFEAPVRAAINAPTAASLDGMAQAFGTMLQRNPSYAMIRWIGGDGRERVRVDAAAAAGPPTRTPESGLQTNVSRYYLREVLALPAGALYVSELDLNLENGVIEQPRRPMFRAAVHVRATAGAVGNPAAGGAAGGSALVISVEGRAILAALDFIAPGPDERRLLLNQRGDFLRGFAPQDEFAFMEGRKVALADRAPQLWAQMQSQPAGALVGEQGLWAWQAMEPANVGAPAVRHQGAAPWFVVSYRPDAALRAAHLQTVGVAIAIALAVLALIAALAWRLASEKAHLAAARHVAEEAARAKAEFLANMSHEIRTPISAILGMAHLIRAEGLSPRQIDRVDKLQAAGERLLNIIRAVLDLSKMEAGKVDLARAQIDVEHILAQVATLVSDGARAQQLSLSVEAGAMPAGLLGDAPLLEQALLNLAANAVKFTTRGSVTLRARLVEATPASAMVRFEVQDTGAGINSEALARLFTPFEQADNTSSRQFGGAGLGLAITRRLARLMGGDAGVASVVGEGSTFWFTARLGRGEPAATAAPLIPAEPAESTESEAHGGHADQAVHAEHAGHAEHALRRDHAHKKLLLAEDNPVNREIMLALLGLAGLSVDVAENGEQAVAKVRAQAYDLVLMDMQMPRLDGPDATRQIRALHHAARLPIIAITANAFADDAQRCFDAGMDDFITKPVKPEVLYAAVLKWLAVTRR